MSDFNHLESYLLPRYWEGHSLGYGEAAWHSHDLSIEYTADRKFAAGRLREYLNDDRSPFSMLSLKRGEVFNPEDHAEGTIVLTKSEVLTRGLFNQSVEIDFDSHADLACPPIDYKMPKRNKKVMPELSLSLRDRGGDNRAGLMYHRQYSWGVITTSRQGNKGLASTLERKMQKGLSDTWYLSSLAVYSCYTAPVTLGEVRHIPPVAKVAPEKVTRMLAVDICSHGSPKKEKTARLAFLARLALQPQPQE